MMMRGKIMEKPSVPMTRLVIRKRAKRQVGNVMRTIVPRERQRTLQEYIKIRGSHLQE